jgi:cation diffusion facilitator family transporter
MDSGSGKKTIFAAIGANLAIAITKFIAAAITGSSAMLSEGIHSSVDTVNELLLLLGIHLSKKPPDKNHPFGHGQELYFWSLIVAILVFSVGGGMSIYEGISHLLHPHPLEDPMWNYIVLGLAIVFEGFSWSVAWKEFQPQKGKQSTWQAIRTSKDPTVFTVLFEDSAALLGLIVALSGIFFGHLFNNPYLDGAASIVIGLILAVIAVVLAYESRGLLLGESANSSTVASIREIAASDPAVEGVMRVLTMHFGPHEILLNLEIQFHKTLSAEEVASAVERIEKTICKKYPYIKNIFIEAQSLTANRKAATSPDEKSST